MRTADELVEFIRERSHEVGTSLTKIEKEVGLSNGRIGKWKTQKRYPPHDTLVAIAALLKISVEELTGGEQKEKPALEGELDEVTQEIFNIIDSANEEKRKKILALLKVADSMGE